MTDSLFPSSLLAPLYSTAEMRAVLDDRARIQRMLDFESALVRAEAAVGTVPAGHASTIAEACARPPAPATSAGLMIHVTSGRGITAVATVRSLTRAR